MTEGLIAWIPLLIIIAGAVWLARYQMRSYSQHIEKVNQINARNLKLNEKNLELNRESIAELKAIRTLLKDKS